MSGNNKITFIGAGGAGSNMLHSFLHKLNAIEEQHKLNLPEIRKIFIDTSKANKGKCDGVNGEFFHISNTAAGGADLAGSGGVRSSNVPHIAKGVLSLINDKKIFDKDNPKEFFVLIGSASGGSSPINPLLLKELARADKPVLTILISDSRNLTYTANSLDSLNTYHSIIASNDLTASMIIRDNATYGEKAVENDINTILTSLVLTLNGKLQDIDESDMAALINMGRLNKIDVPKGISIFDVVPIKDAAAVFREQNDIVSARFISIDEEITPANVINAPNFKKGVYLDSTIVNYLKTVSLNGIVFYNATGRLEETINKLVAIKASQTKILPKDDIKIEAQVDEYGLIL